MVNLDHVHDHSVDKTSSYSLVCTIQQNMLALLLFCSLGCILLLPAGAQPTTTKKLYVKPTDTSHCPEPCHTLDEYVQNASQYFVSNTTFSFLPGNHSLSHPINVSGIVNLAMVAITADTVNIMCKNGLPLSFIEISNLTLENLTLGSCKTLVLTNLVDLNILGIAYSSVSPARRLSYWILDTTNILGRSTIKGLHVDSSIGTVAVEIQISYNDNLTVSPPVSNRLTVKDVIMAFPQVASTQIASELNQSTYSVSVWLDSVTIVTDITMMIDIQSVAHSNITLINFHFKSTYTSQSLPGSLLVFDVSNSSSSMYIKNCTLSSVDLRLELMSTEVMIEDTIVEAKAVFDPIQKHSVLKNVTFTGHGEQITNSEVLFLHSVADLKFVDCTFINKASSDVFSDSLQTAVVWVDKSSNVSFTNCQFSNNSLTPILIADSTIVLLGSNIFSNNTARKGGAMAFYGQSYVTLANGSDTLFINNLAESVGGAIYTNYELSFLCFFTLEGQNSCFNASLPATMRFIGNQAENGGNAMYGASLDTCIVVNTVCQGWNFTYSLFHIDQRNGSVLSAITSEPLRVCLCDENGKPSCGTLFSNQTVFPGEPFMVSAFVVGDRFGTVDGSVYAQILPLHGSYVAELGSLERSQQVTHMKCTNLSYSILSNSSADVSVALTANNARVQKYPDHDKMAYVEELSYYYETTGYIDPILRSFPVFINICLLPCPLGFMLSSEPYQCICDTRLQENHIPCSLITQTVQRSGTEWVNASFHNNTSNGVIVNKYCPNNYCKPETENISLEHPDTQCAFNHSGILCGGCQSGLSLALGSAQCLSCSNYYLALLVPFALAGFALVFFIKLLNLTVAKGTLNGLVFYANIIRANQAMWIPAHHTNILTVFIAWLNLDLGIDTCFFNGLDAHWKTWLQFVFPLYIWAIVIVIIVLSRYSSNAAKIFGSNSVPVLATLFLLSYSKLLRTIISIFQASTLDYPDGTSATMWSYDGNILYFSAKRIPLLLVALLVLLFLWLPYTGVLLFAQCLQHYKIAAFLTKLKPFFDAYFGPLKDNHRYWVGLLLLVRGALFVVYAATPASKADVNLLATAVTMLFPLVYPPFGYVYRKTYLNLLENSFFLNLSLLAVGTLYIQVSGGSQAALAYTSMGISFAVFTGVVFLHSLASLGAAKLISGQANRYSNILYPHANQDREAYERLPEEPKANGPGIRQLRVTLNEYREPVLRYLDDQ